MAKQRSRSSILLLLCLVSLFGLSASLRDMQNNAERFGALCVPLGLYAAGAWYAYKEGARGARIGAAVLGLLIFGGFGFGLVSGLRKAQVNAEIDRELATLRTEFARDIAQDETGVDAVRRHEERMQESVAKLSASSSPDAAAVGRILQRATELRAPIEKRLEAALEAIAADDFLDVESMLAAGNFARQAEIAEEYEHAARAAFDFYGRLQQLLAPDFASSGLSREAQQGMQQGMERTKALTIRTCQGHGRTASEYAKLIAFLSEHHAEAMVAEDGSVSFSTDELAADYEACWERIRDAEQKLNDAVDALQAAMTR